MLMVTRVHATVCGAKAARLTHCSKKKLVMKAFFRSLPLSDLAEVSLGTVRMLSSGLSAVPRLELALLIGLFLLIRS